MICRLTVVLTGVLTGVVYVGSGAAVIDWNRDPIGKGLGKVSCDKLCINPPGLVSTRIMSRNLAVTAIP